MILPLITFSVNFFYFRTIDEDINGKAFRELTDDNLKELGFKMGARINIKGIISSIAVRSNDNYNILFTR